MFKTDVQSEIYLMVDGKKIELEDLEYHMIRESAPLFIMGNPDPRSFSRGRKREIRGSFTINTEVNEFVYGRDCSIHVRPLKNDVEYFFKNVHVTDTLTTYTEDGRRICICQFLATDRLEKPQYHKMNNRQLAVHLLDKEY